MVTFGAAPNNPEAVTDVFAPGEPDADDEAEDDDEAAGLDDPQAARTAQAASETAMSARRRRNVNPR
jgi:hypothetical protein